MAETSGIGKLSIVVYDGRFDRVHYALAMAAAAAAIGRPATLFFTMDASKALAAPTADGVLGWHDLDVRDSDGDAATVDAGYGTRGVGTFEELLEACAAMDVNFMICEMGLRARGLEDMPLRADVTVTEGGLVTFLKDAEHDGAVVFI